MTTSVLLGRMSAAGAVVEVCSGSGFASRSVDARRALAPGSARWRRANHRAIRGRRFAGARHRLRFARRTPSTGAGLGFARAFLAYNLVACGVLIAAYPPLPSGLAALRRGCPARPAGNRTAGGILRTTRGLTSSRSVWTARGRAPRTSLPGCLTAGCDSSHDTLNAELTHLPTHTGL